MNVVCDRAALVEALSLAGSVVPSRTTAPVLGCLALSAEDGILTVASTNAEVGISIGVQMLSKHIGSSHSVSISHRIYVLFLRSHI